MSIVSAPPGAIGRRGDYIQTFTGRKFWPLDPRPEDIELEDIAHALSNQCRFAGHTRSFYSVAEHSVRVMGQCGDESEQRYGLLHDAAEAYLVDLPRPIKHLPILRPYRESEAAVMLCVFERFGLAEVMPGRVHEADQILLATEVRDLMTPNPDVWLKWTEGIWMLPEVIRPWSPRLAERAFLAHAARLGLR